MSPRINKVWRKTDPKVILEEMEKICLPPINLVVERKEFRRLYQEDNESISSFESRIRAKAALCSYNRCKCDKECYNIACGASREEAEIFDLVLGNMKDKTLQKELWRKGVEYNTLGKVLDAIRVCEGVELHQTAAEAGQAVWQPQQGKVKCHNCDQLGHIAKDCTTTGKT